MNNGNKSKKLNSTLKELFGGFLQRKDPAEFFVLMMAVSFFVYLVVYLVIGNGHFSDMFFLRVGDLFMDYFNSIRDAAQGEGVYTVRGVIYPPLANLIFLAISQFAPHGYNNTSFADRKDWIYYPSAILLVALALVICCLVLFGIFREALKRKRILCYLFAFFAIFNSSTLYMLERGNILILCFISLAIFGFTYNSDSKLKREVGIIALAIAIALKLYPALFLWLFLTDKRYKDFFRCIAYAAFLIIIPSFFFGGPECLITLLGNTFNFSSKQTSSTSAITVIAGFLHIPSKLLSLGAYLWCFVCMISFMVSALRREEGFKLWTKAIILILTAPPLTSQYVWTFFLIPIVLLCNRKRTDKADLPFIILMFIPFIFIISRFNYFLTINSLLVYICTALLSFVCLADTIRLLVKEK